MRTAQLTQIMDHGAIAMRPDDETPVINVDSTVAVRQRQRKRKYSPAHAEQRQRRREQSANVLGCVLLPPFFCPSPPVPARCLWHFGGKGGGLSLLFAVVSCMSAVVALLPLWLFVLRENKALSRGWCTPLTRGSAV